MTLFIFIVQSDWFNGACELLTYELEELAGTKMRAMYQRRKARDLFDLSRILQMVPDLDKDKVLESYRRYLSFVVSHLPTYKEMLINMNEKLSDEEYLGDTNGLLRPDTPYDPQAAYQLVHDELIIKLKNR